MVTKGILSILEKASSSEFLLHIVSVEMRTYKHARANARTSSLCVHMNSTFSDMHACTHTRMLARTYAQHKQAEQQACGFPWFLTCSCHGLHTKQSKKPSRRASRADNLQGRAAPGFQHNTRADSPDQVNAGGSSWIPGHDGAIKVCGHTRRHRE